MTTPSTTQPKVFLSYSWSSPELIDQVAGLAERLVSHGVEVIFDQWDLKEGYDVHTFMEQSVSRADVTHVLILCDPVYASKANDREGGVGTETLIISPSVYKNVTQSRVIPVILERDANDDIQVPVYLQGRRYVDMSRPETEPDAYEQLLRILYDKPARIRPQPGEQPEFLKDGFVPLRTTAALSLFKSAAMAGKLNAGGLFADFLERFYQALLDIELAEGLKSLDELEEWIISSIEGFHRYRDEFTEAVHVLVDCNTRMLSNGDPP